ncbi:sensor histidine kinase [Trinickia dabaoshanensis]|uniref:sensor histidine kinase n=1 Tax=Trinickia dabaoshanensis TaxID=564714 RepID=UPI001E531CCE|nr:HAMP domain-containing sensor histidine kinase [Trinickia dabaoshanensis]
MSTFPNAAAASDERLAHLRAEVALFMRDHVLSLVSHDLRSPLNAIHSWAYVLERKLDAADASAQRALAGIRSGVEQQVKLLEDAVDKTRAETKSLPLERESFPIRAAIERALDDARRALLEARGTAVEFDSTLDAERCDGDSERLAQALWTMLVFASEASAPGSTIVLKTALEAGVWRSEVAFTPNLATLADAELPHALEPFARTQATAPREAGRIAWVLALVQRVALAHGGTFEQGTMNDAEPTSLVLRVPLSAQ